MAVGVRINSILVVFVLECNYCVAHAELKDVQAFVDAFLFNVGECHRKVLHSVADCFEAALWVHILDIETYNCYAFLLKFQLFISLLEGQQDFKGVLLKLDGFASKCCLN